MMKTVVSCLVKKPNFKNLSSFYILNGNIEIDKSGNEYYKEDTFCGEKQMLVKDMPQVVQEAIEKNKTLIEV